MVGGLALHKAHLITAPNSLFQLSEQKPREQASCLALSRPQLHTIEEFKQLHAQFIKLGLDQVPRCTGELLSACALSPWGEMGYAVAIFNSIEFPGTFHFDTMIKAYANDSDPEAALLMYIEMHERGVRPDNFTFPFAIKACAQLSGIKEGAQIHAHCIKFGFECDVYVQNSLINMYGKCGDIKLSCRVFDQLGTIKTVASWSALLAAHTRIGMWNECLRLFAKMNNEGFKPDESTMVGALSSSAHLGAFDLGRSIHCSLLRNFTELNVIVQTSLIEMYVDCGELEKGLQIFERMLEKNSWTYSVMISGLARHGAGERALRVFSDMLKEGIEQDEVIYIGVLNACSNAGLLEEGLRCFDRMRLAHRIKPRIQHYNCMVDLMGRVGKLEEAYELIKSMPMEPNEVSWRCLLTVSKIHGDLRLAEIASKNLMQLNSQNTGDYVMLSNMYARAQRWGDAARIRTDIVGKGLIQVPGFSRVEVKGKMHTFVSQDRSHPQSKEVYEMLYQMEWQLRFEGYRPDTSEVVLDIGEEEKQQMIRGHSQKLAMAFALLSTGERSTIRIVTNLRMCGECHAYSEMISKIFQREIVVRDRYRFHRFRHGACSCRGNW